MTLPATDLWHLKCLNTIKGRRDLARQPPWIGSQRPQATCAELVHTGASGWWPKITWRPLQWKETPAQKAPLGPDFPVEQSRERAKQERVEQDGVASEHSVGECLRAPQHFFPEWSRRSAKGALTWRPSGWAHGFIFSLSLKKGADTQNPTANVVSLQGAAGLSPFPYSYGGFKHKRKTGNKPTVEEQEGCSKHGGGGFTNPTMHNR